MKRIFYVILFVIIMINNTFGAILYVGQTCQTQSYSSIQAAVNAAQSGDTIKICNGTYNEAVSIDNKDLIVEGISTDPTKVVVQNNAIVFLQKSGTLKLRNMTVKATGNTAAIQTEWNAYGPHEFENLIIQGMQYGIYAQRGASKIKDVSISGAYNISLYVGNRHDILFENVKIATASTGGNGISINNSDNGIYSKYTFNKVDISSVGYCIFIGIGNKVVMDTVNASSSNSNCIIFDYNVDGEHELQNVVAKSGTNSGTTAINISRGASLLRNIYAESRASGGGNSYGIVVGNKYSTIFDNITAKSSAHEAVRIFSNDSSSSQNYTFKNITAESYSTSIRIQRSSKVVMEDVYIKSNNGDGIRLDDDSDGEHELRRIVVIAEGYGLFLQRGAKILDDITITTSSADLTQAGIHLGNKYAINANKISINATNSAKGIYIEERDSTFNNSYKFNNININSGSEGIRIKKSYQIIVDNATIESRNSDGVYFESNSNGDHILTNISIKAINGKGISIANGFQKLEDFKIEAKYGVVTTSNKNLTISKGTIKVGGANDSAGIDYTNGIIAGSLNVSNVSIIFPNTAGTSTIGIRIRKSSSSSIDSVCINGSSNAGVYTDNDASNVTIQNSIFSGYSNYGVSINSSSGSHILVTNNAFLKSSAPRAYSNSNSHKFNGNYWQGFTGNNYVDGNVRDNSPLSSPPNNRCYVELIAEYRMDYDTWQGQTVYDTSGNNLHGTAVNLESGFIFHEEKGKICGSSYMTGSDRFNGGYVKLDNLPVNTNPGAQTTVAFWMYWRGDNFVMPFGWTNYDLYFSQGSFGFNTNNSDIYGISSAGLANRWVHVVAVFTNGDVTQNELWIDGVKMNLSQRIGNPQNNNAFVSSSAGIGTFRASLVYLFKSRVDELKIWNGKLSDTEIQQIYTRERDGKDWKTGLQRNCQLPQPQLLVDYTFDYDTWQGTTVLDRSGNGRNGIANNVNSGYVYHTFSGKMCGSAYLQGSGGSNGGYIEMKNLPVDTSAGAKHTVSFWMYWDGTDSVMPFGWNIYDLWLVGNNFGFNTGGGDLYGIDATNLKNKWVHVTAVFTNRDYTLNELYINGQRQILTQKQNSIIVPNAVVSSTARIGVWVINKVYMFHTNIDEFKMWKGALDNETILQIYNNELNGREWFNGQLRQCPCQKPVLLAEYTMDSWSGTTVYDTSGNNKHGTTYNVGNGGVWQDNSGKVGKSAGFGGARPDFGGYIQLSNLNVDTSPGAKTTVAFWMYWNGFNSRMPFGWNRHDLWLNDGYFGFNTSGGDLYGISSSGLQNNWVHVVAIFTNNNIYDNELYINGVKQTLSQKLNSPIQSYAVVVNNPRIGVWNYDTNYLFRSYIDEVKIFNGALSPQDILNMYTKENGGTRWTISDMTTCQPQNQLSYLYFTWSESALTCQPLQVTIKACMDNGSDCSQPYTAGVSNIQLSATDGATWSPNSSVNIPSGNDNVTTNLIKTTAGTTSISATSASPMPSNNPIFKCQGGNCNINFKDADLTLIDYNGQSLNSVKVPNQISYKPFSQYGYTNNVPYDNVTPTLRVPTNKPDPDNSGITQYAFRSIIKDDTTGACVSNLNGQKAVTFKYNYVCGSGYYAPYCANPLPDRLFFVNNSPISRNGSTVNLTFTNGISSPFQLRLNDAGIINFSASTDVAVDNQTKTLSYTSNNFTVRPLGYIVEAWNAGDCSNSPNA
ncbi:MAG: LamG-like jellyroll fold domain-containing protein, partial [Candidatus Micrarchaeia archaeon]